MKRLILATLSFLTITPHATVITAPDGAAFDQAGSAVASNSQYLAIASPRDDDSGSNSGAVNIYSATTGSFIRKITPPLPYTNNQFGNALDLDGHLIIIGSRNDDEFGTNAGAAFLYNLLDGSLVKKITSPEPDEGNQFGHSVSIDNGNIAIGAWLSDKVANEGGSVFLFNIDNNDSITITPPSPNDFDQFGASVSISGNQVAVGSPFRDSAIENTGSAYVFSLTGNLLHQFSSPSTTIGAVFGASVDLEGNNLIVGAPEANSTGLVFLFDLNTPETPITISAPDSQAGDKFGEALSIKSNLILIAAHSFHHAATDSGKVYLFDLDTNLITSFTHPNPANADLFGFSVSLSSEAALIGTPKDDDLGSSSGTAIYLPIRTPSQELSVTLENSGNALLLSWNPLDNISNYQIETSTDLETWQTWIPSTPLTSHNISLTPSTPKQFYRVTPLSQ